jgi:hypothetical protein
MKSDIIEIGEPKIKDLNIETLDFNDVGNSKRLPSVNFGGGIELLMNDKKKTSMEKSGMSSDIDLGDINELENELNDLSQMEKQTEKSKGKSRSSLFSSMLNTSSGVKLNDNETFDDNNSIRDDIPTIRIGKETARDVEETKTWDGFQKFNDIPLDPVKNISTNPSLSKEELLREKFKYLRRLEELESKGVKLSKKYTLNFILTTGKRFYHLSTN